METKTTYVLAAAALALATSTASLSGAADVIPAPQGPSDGNSIPPSSEPTIPEVTPSPRDPGMVKQPEAVPHPDSVVTPPVVDPKMAVNPDEPETAPRDQRAVPNERKPERPPSPAR